MYSVSSLAAFSSLRVLSLRVFVLVYLQTFVLTWELCKLVLYNCLQLLGFGNPLQIYSAIFFFSDLFYYIIANAIINDIANRNIRYQRTFPKIS